jgi:hypothetical protein
MQNWVAVAIAFGVLVVGYAQWHTANQRVVLDLFERRLKIFDALDEAISEVMRVGEVERDALGRYLTAKMSARFLFGDDVMTYLDALWKDLVSLSTVYRNEVIDTRKDRAQAIEKKFEVLERVLQWAERAPPMFAPYMRITTRNTPFWRPW